jgi:hypothetical protein
MTISSISGAGEQATMTSGLQIQIPLRKTMSTLSRFIGVHRRDGLVKRKAEATRRRRPLALRACTPAPGEPRGHRGHPSAQRSRPSITIPRVPRRCHCQPGTGIVGVNPAITLNASCHSGHLLSLWSYERHDAHIKRCDVIVLADGSWGARRLSTSWPWSRKASSPGQLPQQSANPYRVALTRVALTRVALTRVALTRCDRCRPSGGINAPHRPPCADDKDEP